MNNISVDADLIYRESVAEEDALEVDEEEECSDEEEEVGESFDAEISDVLFTSSTFGYELEKGGGGKI